MAEDKSSSMENKADNRSDQLSHQFIKQITNDFDEALIVGADELGTVYKGICEDGEEIAVKVLTNMSGFESNKFQKEFENLRRLEHQNIVKLVGFCSESEKVVAEYKGKEVIAQELHMALCYEYVHNDSLAKHISADGCSGLSWHTQYKIIKGICQGLEYLQHGLEFSVWHLNLRPDNILLDKNMIPKIAYYGLSRFLGDENTGKIPGPFRRSCYSPIEYTQGGVFTNEQDIFSLGFIITNLMAGHEGFFKAYEMRPKRFIEHVRESWRKRLCETMAPKAAKVYCKQVKICIQIAVKCMMLDRQVRPTIQSIVSKLTETERMVGNRRLHTEKFNDGESILPKGGIQATAPG